MRHMYTVPSVIVRDSERQPSGQPDQINHELTLKLEKEREAHLVGGWVIPFVSLAKLHNLVHTT